VEDIVEGGEVRCYNALLVVRIPHWTGKHAKPHRYLPFADGC
jgi:hypothetical protein